MLARHTPERLDARIPCGTEPVLGDAAGPIVLLATARDAARWNALEVVRSAATGETIIRVGRVELARIAATGPATRCRLDVSLRGTGWTVRQSGVLDRSGTLASPARVFGLITQLDLRVHPALGVTIRPIAQDTRASTAQTALRMLAALLLVAATVLVLSAGPRRRAPTFRRVRVAPQDFVVAFVLAAWWLLAPLHYDDGWVRARQTNSLASGGFSNYYEHWGSNLPLDVWLEWLQRLVVAHTSALAVDRLPSMLLLAATWCVCRVSLARSLGRSPTGREPAWWAAALTFCLGSMAFGVTLRPEPMVALLATAVLASCLAYLAKPAIDVLLFALVLCGLAVTVHPAGAVAGAPLVLCLPQIVRDARARISISVLPLLAALLIGGAWTLLLAFMDADTQSRETDADLIRSAGGHSDGILQELQRYGRLGENGASPVRRLFVGLLLLAAVTGIAALLRRRPLATCLPSASVAVSLLLLSITPSKWIWHFGALIGVGAVAVGFETYRLGDARSSQRARTAFAAAVAGIALAAAVEANHSGPLDTGRLDWSVIPAWYLLALLAAGAGVLVAGRRKLPRRPTLVVLPAILASTIGMTMLLFTADTAATSGWTAARQAAASLVGRDACGVASDLVVAAPSGARLAAPDVASPSRRLSSVAGTPAEVSPALLDAAGETRWFDVGRAPIGLFIGGSWAPRQALLVSWGRRGASGVERLGSGEADLRQSTEGPDFAHWRFVTEASFPTRPLGAKMVRFRLGRPTGRSSARITSPTTSVDMPLSRLLERKETRSLVSPFLFEAMPCASLPSLAYGVAAPPEVLVEYDPGPPLTAPTSPFVGLSEVFDVDRFPVRSPVDRGALFVYRVRPDPRDAVAPATERVVS